MACGVVLHAHARFSRLQKSSSSRNNRLHTQRFMSMSWWFSAQGRRTCIKVLMATLNSKLECYIKVQFKHNSNIKLAVLI